jgi:molecular chaperone HtpG
MSDNISHIPFQVDVSRIIEVLAKQIYQSPLALLRENTQNSFDAILLRRHLGQQFDARIDVTLTPDEITIRDNGIGMTADDLRVHYWHAGSSSKNNDAAREAGVVGTFGIGAMANFGIADELSIETESAITGQRTRSAAQKISLSTTEDCISLLDLATQESAGTEVRAVVAAGGVNVAEATNYIADFVAFVDIPVYVNGALVSQQSISEALQVGAGEDISFPSCDLSSDFVADVQVRVAPTGPVSVRATEIRYRGAQLKGALILRQGDSSIRTFRSGFGLATVGVSSHYQLGGLANLNGLQPTAGREALTTESMQMLQGLVSALDVLLSVCLSDRPESDLNTNFMEWVRRHGRYDLCGQLRSRVEPGNRRVQLKTLQSQSQTHPILLFTGSDTNIIDAVATDDSPLVVLATGNPRRQCEDEYIKQYCKFELVQDTPTVLDEKAPKDWTIEEQAIVFRVKSILETDYFVQAVIRLGRLSHGLPIVAELQHDPLHVVLDPAGPTFNVVRELYRTDLTAFGSMVKDFVRNVIFQKVADRVPSSTRQGAEAFLKSIRRTRDVFEYEWADLDSLGSVWSDYLEGRLTMEEAAERSSYIVQRNVQLVDSSTSQAIRDVVPDVLTNDEMIGDEAAFGPAPPILRTEVGSDAKLLTIDPNEAPLKGYRCFIAISERARTDRGEFFLQPHSTSVVWGGQKVLFVFEHHSGQFGLYYDLQTAQSVSPVSGGGPFPTATLVLRDRIYIPVPDAVAAAFIPAPDERKRFEVRCDLLYTEEQHADEPPTGEL